jgi:hypothetical protein
MRLWRVFWFGYALPNFVFGVAVRMIAEVGASRGAFAWLLVLAVPYGAWICVSLWRCAPNTDHQLAAGVARVWAVVVGGTTIASVMELLRATS